LEDASHGGLRAAFARLGAAALELLKTRADLAALEFSEHRDRARTLLILLGVAGIAFAFAAMSATALVVVYFWETYRIAALVGVTLIYVVVGVFALWRLSEHRRTDPTPFAETRAELERDREWLAGHLRRDK
jgi:uncharacterized membrane protein YqjE